MKKYMLAILFLVQIAFVTKVYAQNVSINSTGNLADTSAMLDVSSTNKGFLAPRMTTAQQNAIILPATGLLIFNSSTNLFMVNTGSSITPVWTPLVSGSTTHTLGSVTNTLTSVVNGVSATSPIVNSVSNNSSANTLSTVVNGVAGAGVNLINSNALNSSTNTLTSTVNGVASGGVNIINSNTLGLSGGSLTSTVNGVASIALSLNSLDSSIYKTDGTLQANRTVTMSANNLTFGSTSGNIIFNPSSTGKVGIGTTAPAYELDVSASANPMRLGGLQNGTTSDSTLTVSNGVIKRVTPTPKGIIGTLGAGYTIPGTATGTYYCTGSSITLPPGKYMVFAYMMTDNNLNSNTSPGSFFFKTLFADASWGTTAGTTSSPATNTTMVTADIVGSSKLISGSISCGQPYNPISGFQFINNTSGANKTYYFWAGWVQLTTVNNTSKIDLFGGTNYGEDNIVAFPVN